MEQETPETGRQLVHRPASAITMRVPKWLWEKRIPMTGITLLAGKPGIGKSSVALMIAAKLTKGTLEGKHLGVPRGVAIVATEDDWSSTIAPRLVAAGADLSRVHQIEARQEGRLETISVPNDLNDLGPLCDELGIGLIIIDPIMSILPGGIDTHKDREVRRALEPLAKDFSQKFNIPVMGLIHVIKGNGTDPLEAIMGSRAFGAVSRSALFCSADPDDEDTFLLGHIKSNLGPEMETLSYRLIDTKVQMLDPETNETVDVGIARAILGAADDRSIAEVLVDKNSNPVGGLSKELVDFVSGFPGAVRFDQIAREFKETDKRTLNTYLGRLVKKGRIDRPERSIYQAVSHRPDMSTDQQPPSTTINTTILVDSVDCVDEASTSSTLSTRQRVVITVDDAEARADSGWPKVEPPEPETGPEWNEWDWDG